MLQALDDTIKQTSTELSWRANAVTLLKAEQLHCGETPLIELPLSNAPGVRLFIKDEAQHPSGSLKHRLARSLFLHALCNGWIGAGTTIVEASSGSTAVSAAWFASLLGLRFIAVVPESTATEKIALVEASGGECLKVKDARLVQAEASAVARACGGHLLNQFTYAERATDWRDSDNIASSIFRQLYELGVPKPSWIVCGAGTGGTATTIGRHLRYMGYGSQLCVADPAASVFHRHFADRTIVASDDPISCVEGIGRPRVEASFFPDVVDRMIVVEDDEGIAAAHHLSKFMGRSCGPSTGVNLHACMVLATEMIRRGQTGSIVTLLCDAGERYLSTCHDPQWCAARGFTLESGHIALSTLMPH